MAVPKHELYKAVAEMNVELAYQRKMVAELNQMVTLLKRRCDIMEETIEYKNEALGMMQKLVGHLGGPPEIQDLNLTQH